MSKQSARAVAWGALKYWDVRGGHLSDVLSRALTGIDMAPNDRRMCQELVFGVVRWQRWLDHVAAGYMTKKPGLPLRNLSRLGAYQLLFMDAAMPVHAAVHETVGVAREVGLGRLSGVTNAVLRKIAASVEDWSNRRRSLETTDPGLALSHPDLLVDRWRSWMPEDRVLALMRANNESAAVFLRINTLRVAPEEAHAALLGEGIPFEGFGRHALVIRLGRGFGVLEDLPGFFDGWFYVQDPSTLEPVDALDPRPGERVLDLCSAPGGKTTYMAQMMEDRGEIVAVDVDARRLDRLRQNCERLGVNCVQPLLWDPHTDALTDLLDEQRFDAVLVDVPCSNTGVIRRRPEVRWRLEASSWDDLEQTQTRLLQLAADQVRPGGRLVYSTCSVEWEENQERVEAFLRKQARWRKMDSKLVSGWENGHDSGYYCCLNRD